MSKKKKYWKNIIIETNQMTKERKKNYFHKITYNYAKQL